MTMKKTLFALLAINLAGFASVQATPQPLPGEKAIEFAANSGDKTEALAGHLFVPENRNNPHSRQIRINYVRFPATTERKGPPIVYLAGGPGGSGIGTAKWRRFPLFMALREYGDVIALDQRGTGESEQTEACVSGISMPLNQRLDEQQVIQDYRRAARECLETWKRQGAEVMGYTTVQNALDIDALRRHLKADKVSLWGISYGSHLALSAMKLFPERIEKVIIASAEGLDQTVKLPAMTDDYFARLQQVLDQQPLGQRIPDLPGLIGRVHQKLDKSPLPLQIPHRDGTSTDMLFQTRHLQGMAGMMIADPNVRLSMLLHIYLGLETGNTDMLMAVLQRGIFKDEPISFKLMPLAIDVASGITAARLDKVKTQAETALLGEMLNFPMPLLNKLDPQLDLGDDFRAEVVSSIPTLLFTGSLDGRTYPGEQREAVQGLSNLKHVEVTHAGHNLYMASHEVLARMQAFLSGQTVATNPIVLPLPDLNLKR